MPFFVDLRRNKVVLGELVAEESASDSGKVYIAKPEEVRWTVLMRTIGDLSLITQVVSPFVTASSAVRLMREHSLRVMAVTEENHLLGIVTLDRLKHSAPDEPVRELMESLIIEMQSDLPVRSAAQLFVQNQLDCVPVMDNGGFRGLLTANQLLIELGQSWDPITGLSWSDRLRDWGVDTLQSGQEVTVVFIDLNSFGAYNKVHGHIIGDRVLKALGRILSETIDSNRDVLVRYGGDEFVIGSTRSRAELEEMVARLASTTINVEGVPETVSFSAGFAGGKRSRERERTHYASTLDNLINLASQDSQSKKPHKKQAIHPVASPASATVEVARNQDSWSSMVAITVGTKTVLGTTTVPTGNALLAVAESAAQAVSKLEEQVQLSVKDIVIYRRWDGRSAAIVQVEFQSGGATFELRAQASSQVGVYESVADAIVEARVRALAALKR